MSRTARSVKGRWAIELDGDRKKGLTFLVVLFSALTTFQSPMETGATSRPDDMEEDEVRPNAGEVAKAGLSGSWMV